MDYYEKKQYLAQVDEKDKIIGKIEKWEAHKKGVLHRGYTCILTYQDKALLQHRKHPVFDSVFDLSFSSHQIYLSQDLLQNDADAIYDGLKREWNIDKNFLVSEPRFMKKIYYKAKDPNSEYTEHEIDHIYSVELKKLPNPNLDFCCGFKLINLSEITRLPAGQENSKLKIKLAPWVKVILGEKIIK